MNFFLLVFRNLVKQKYSTLLAMIGFFTSFIVIIAVGEFSLNELSVDSYHDNKDDIYMIAFDKYSYIPTALLDEMESYSEIDRLIPLGFPWDGNVLKYENRDAEEVSTAYVNQAFFNSFSFRLLKGSFDEIELKNTVVLTKKCAHRLFGSVDPLNKIIKLDNREDLRVIALIEDYPPNSSLQSQAFISFETYKNLNTFTFGCGWDCSNLSCLLHISKNADVKRLEKRIDDAIKKGKAIENPNVSLISLPDFYFDNQIVRSQFMAKGDKNQVWIILGFAALLILVLFFNQLGLVYRGVIRFSERDKVLQHFGQSYLHSFVQCFMEQSMIIITSFIFSIFLWYTIIKEHVYSFMALQVNNDGSFSFILVMALILLVGILFMSWLRITMSNYLIKKKNTNVIKGAVTIQKAFLSIQLSISILLVIVNMFMSEQIKYLFSKDVGFEKEALITIPNYKESTSSKSVLGQELRQIPGIIDVSFTDAVPGGNCQNWQINKEINGKEVSFDYAMIPCSSNYIDNLGLNFQCGRSFYKKDLGYKNTNTDFGSLIINSSMANLLGGVDCLGMELMDWDKMDYKGKIVGIVDDFHYYSLREEVRPMAFCCDGRRSHLVIKLEGGYRNQQEVLTKLQRSLKKLEPSIPFEVHYFDSLLENLYQKDRLFQVLTQWLSVLTNLVTLFGLVSTLLFLIERKRKEMGIRKVNGASDVQLVYYIGNNFSYVLPGALFIGISMAFVFVRYWSQQFAYHSPFSILYFVRGPFVILLVIVVIITAFSLQVIYSDPVKCLKDE